MGELIPFRPRRVDAVINTRTIKPPQQDIIQLSSGSTAEIKSHFVIPSIKDLYDETRTNLSLGQGVTVERVSVADLRRALTDDPEFEGRDRRRELERLEENLAVARGECIVGNIPNGPLRKRALIDLAKFTYVTALDIGSDLLRDGAVAILVKVVGSHEAHTISENIRIKRETEKKKTQ